MSPWFYILAPIVIGVIIYFIAIDIDERIYSAPESRERRNPQ